METSLLLRTAARLMSLRVQFPSDQPARDPVSKIAQAAAKVKEFTGRKKEVKVFSLGYEGLIPKQLCETLTSITIYAISRQKSTPAGRENRLDQCCPAEESILPSYWHWSNLLLAV